MRKLELGGGAAIVAVTGPRVKVSRGFSQNVNPHLPGPTYIDSFAFLVHTETGAITVSQAVEAQP